MYAQAFAVDSWLHAASSWWWLQYQQHAAVASSSLSSPAVQVLTKQTGTPTRISYMKPTVGQHILVTDEATCTCM